MDRPQPIKEGKLQEERPLRVFHLIKGLGRGGAEVLLSEGLRHADRERFTYGYGYFLPWKDHLVASLGDQGAEVRRFTARSSPAVLLASWKVARFLRRWQPDLLHCHLPLSGIVGRGVGRWLGVPVVYTEHNEMQHYHPASRWLNLATWDWQAQVVAVSGDVAHSIRGHAGHEGPPLRVVRNGVSLDGFAPARHDGRAVRAEWGIPPGAPVVGTVAVFREQKQLHHWLAAAKKIRDARSDVHFLLVGEGELRSELEAHSRTLGLDGAAHFTGLQDEVKPFLAAMDVYMMSSRFEGLPIALLEAAAMARPVVATAVGGVPDVVQDGEAGFLTEPGEPEALAAAALRLLGEKALRRRMGRAAREVVARDFSMERMAGELEAIYKSVLAGKRLSDGRSG